MNTAGGTKFGDYSVVHSSQLGEGKAGWVVWYVPSIMRVKDGLTKRKAMNLAKWLSEAGDQSA